MKTSLETSLKRRGRVLAALAIVLVVPALVIAAYQVSELDVGMTGNTANVKSAAIGTGNTASYHSLNSGANNWSHDLSFAAGHSNETRSLSGAVGWLNDVNLSSGQYPRSGMAVGYLNVVFGNNAFAAGQQNTISADNAAALGHGLATTADAATVVGSYNVDKEDLRFAVGTGTGPTTNERANAFEVYANGDIVMKPQGDISMGEFDDIP